jgi:hypothetical protein
VCRSRCFETMPLRPMGQATLVRAISRASNGDTKIPSGQAPLSSLPCRAIRRTAATIWKLEASLKCRSCKDTPPVRMIKPAAARGITPDKRVHPEPLYQTEGKLRTSAPALTGAMRSYQFHDPS